MNVESENRETFFAHPSATLDISDEEVVDSWVFNKTPRKFGDRKSVKSMAGLMNFYEGILERIFCTRMVDPDPPDPTVNPPPISRAEYGDFVKSLYYRRSIGELYEHIRDANKDVFDQMVRAVWQTFFADDLNTVTSPGSGSVKLLGWRMFERPYFQSPWMKIDSSEDVLIQDTYETNSIGWEDGLWDKDSKDTGKIASEIKHKLGPVFPNTNFRIVDLLGMDFYDYLNQASSLMVHECDAMKDSKSFDLESTDHYGNIPTNITYRSSLLTYGLSQTMLSAMNNLSFQTDLDISFNHVRKSRNGRWIYSFDENYNPVIEGSWEDWYEEGEDTIKTYVYYGERRFGGLGFSLRVHFQFFIGQEPITLSDAQLAALPISEDGNFRVLKLGKNISFYVDYTNSEVIQPAGEPVFDGWIIYEHVNKLNGASGMKGWPSKWVIGMSSTGDTLVRDIEFSSFVRFNAGGFGEESDGDWLWSSSGTYQPTATQGSDFSEVAMGLGNGIIKQAEDNFSLEVPQTIEPNLEELTKLINERWASVSLLYPLDSGGRGWAAPVATESEGVRRGFDGEYDMRSGYFDVNYADFDASIVFGPPMYKYLSGIPACTIGTVKYKFNGMWVNDAEHG